MIEWNGIKMQGDKIDLVRYADDKALVPSKEEPDMSLRHMQKILITNYNVKINTDKTR